jgi:hypothetical protein
MKWKFWDKHIWVEFKQEYKRIGKFNIILRYCHVTKELEYKFSLSRAWSPNPIAVCDLMTFPDIRSRVNEIQNDYDRNKICINRENTINQILK